MQIMQKPTTKHSWSEALRRCESVVGAPWPRVSQWLLGLSDHVIGVGRAAGSLHGLLLQKQQNQVACLLQNVQQN